MLTIYFEDNNYDKSKLIHDVEYEFMEIELNGSDIEKLLLNDIEQAKYSDKGHFIDRFGVYLTKEFLSTGCKAALIVINRGDKIINTVECGRNALASIIEHCSSGAILMHNDCESIPYINNTNIDVVVDNNHFTDFDRLNRYIEER